jgi:hypothetical protein
MWSKIIGWARLESWESPELVAAQQLGQPQITLGERPIVGM